MDDDGSCGNEDSDNDDDAGCIDDDADLPPREDGLYAGAAEQVPWPRVQLRLPDLRKLLGLYGAGTCQADFEPSVNFKSLCSASKAYHIILTAQLILTSCLIHISSTAVSCPPLGYGA